jgi:hypothetical protein
MSKRPDMKTVTPGEWREWWSAEQRRITLRTLRGIRREAEERAAQKAAPRDCCRCVQQDALSDGWTGSKRRGGIEHEGHNLCSSCFFEVAIAKHEF